MIMLLHAGNPAAREVMVMDKLNIRRELNPTPKNPLVALTTKIEELIANEPVVLAMSALLSAALRLETCRRNGNERAAAECLARTLDEIARTSNN